LADTDAFAIAMLISGGADVEAKEADGVVTLAVWVREGSWLREMTPGVDESDFET